MNISTSSTHFMLGFKDFHMLTENSFTFGEKGHAPWHSAADLLYLGVGGAIM